MKAAHVFAAGLLLLTTPALGKNEPPPHDFGPPPDWEHFRQIGEEKITGILIDPDSAKIRWTGGYHKGGFKPFLEGWVQGYYACGMVNSRNRMGGYAGATSFVVVIDYDRALYANIDRTPGGMVAGICANAERQGFFPAVPASAAGTITTTDRAGDGDGPATISPSSLTLRAMPDGAYVSAVAAGSPAASAGLKPGMVIGAVNAIPLAGMGEAMLKVVDAAGMNATLTIVGGATIKLGAPR